MAMELDNHSTTGSIESDGEFPVILSDSDQLIPLKATLDESDIALLLTPLIVPPDAHNNKGETSDPFEPLGRALAKGFPAVRHVPYTKQGGITSTHAEFLNKAGFVVFVAIGLAAPVEPSHLELAGHAYDLLGDYCPFIVLVCDDESETETWVEAGFPTVISVPGISKPDLEAAAALLLDGPAEDSSSSAASTSSMGMGMDSMGLGMNLGTSTGMDTSIEAAGNNNEIVSSSSWSVELWDSERDLQDMFDLWSLTVENTPHSVLPQWHFEKLARHNGLSFNLVVRDPAHHPGLLIGFCLTWVSYCNTTSADTVASIATLIVREGFRGRGIGRALHDESMARSQRRPDLAALNFGSIHPRLYRGIPADAPESSPNMKWLSHRGWNVSGTSPGTGNVITDWILRFQDQPCAELATAGLTFRPCLLTSEQWETVSEMVDQYADKYGYQGYSEAYSRTMDSADIGDVILGFEGENLVASALVYEPKSESSFVAQELTWARHVGPNMAGMTYIVIRGKHTTLTISHDNKNLIFFLSL